jgi:glycosyltransferase involved in cell wall biosynthesis
VRITIVQGPFLPVPPVRGGAIEKTWFALGQEFARRGHEVVQISRQCDGLPQRECIAGVQHIRVAGFDAPPAWRPILGVDLLWPTRVARDFLYSRRVRAVLPEADVVVTNTFCLPALLPRTGRHGALFVHVGRFPRAQMRLYRHAARLQAPSSVVAQALAERMPGCDDRICTIPYSLDETMRLASAGEFAEAELQREKRIVFAGRIHPQKGLDLLIDAFTRFSKKPAGQGWRLQIIGPDDPKLGGGGTGYREDLGRRAPNADIEWTGFVRDPSELRRHLVRAGVFVYPSVDETGESFGLAALEAMGCGCPVIVSDLACFRDFVVPDVTGFIFNHRATDPADRLAELFGRLAGSPTQRSSVARNGWDKTEEFLLPAVATRFLAEFERITVV